MTFELETWGDGTIRLVHWDTLHGDDIIFVLCDDGNAFKTVRAPGGEEYHLEPANLVLELRELVKDGSGKND